MRTQRKFTITSLTVAMAILSGCSAPTPTPTVTTEAPPSATAPSTPSPTPEPQAERGTRDNPLAIGEYRKLSNESMWTVGAESATVVSDGYVVLPLRLGVDWEAARVQAEAQGASIDSGIDPWQALVTEYVTAEGRSYATMDTYDIDIPNELYTVGNIYSPVDAISANVAVSVPVEEATGGVWVVRNSSGASVFIASQ